MPNTTIFSETGRYNRRGVRYVNVYRDIVPGKVVYGLPCLLRYEATQVARENKPIYRIKVIMKCG